MVLHSNKDKLSKEEFALKTLQVLSVLLHLLLHASQVAVQAKVTIQYQKGWSDE